MRLIVDNIATSAVVGGKDNLLNIDILSTLRDYLRARPTGYSQVTSYRTHKWDGYTYFITPKGKFATGFLPLVIPYLEELGVEITIEDNRVNLPEFTNTAFSNYVGKVDGEEWYAEGKYAFQVTAAESVNNHITYAGGTKKLYFPRGILDCATNAGKTSIAALVINNLPKDSTVLFTTSSTLIYDQAVKFFKDIVGDDDLGEVKSGVFRPSRVTVIMVKSLLNKCEQLNVRKWLNSVQALIVDEADEAGAKEYTKLLQYVNAGVRILISGTPLDSPDKTSSMRCIGHSGKVNYKITNAELIALGVSQMPTVIIKHNATALLVPKFYDYPTEMEQYVHSSVGRLEQIKSIVDKHSDEQILITFKDIAHGHRIYQYLYNNTNLDIAIAHSSHGTYECDRAAAVADFKSGRVSVLVCSHIIKRGVNINTIRVLIRAEAGKSVTDAKQIAGRATRHDGANDNVTMYDFYDEGKYLSKHSRDRVKAYRSQGFKVETEYEEFRNKPKL